MTALVLQNSTVERKEKSVKDFLKECASNAYTTLRTNKGKFFLLQQHLDRLYESMVKINGEELVNQAYGSREAVFQQVKLGLKLIHETAKMEWNGQEFRITILFDAIGFGFKYHLAVLPHTTHYVDGVNIQLYGSPRNNPLAKNSSWVTEREEYAKYILADRDINEMVLIDSALNVYEGLTSNFFVLQRKGKKWELITEGVGALAGTVQTLVLELAKAEEIHIERRCPRLKEVVSCESSCAVSSTGRILAPVKGVYVLDESEYASTFSGEKNFTLVAKEKNEAWTRLLQLRESVLMKVDENSTFI
eukprot:snap_masked-scaffold_6-processed-gene-3.37-mRNA-1 protein AED:1.00 eAED:1.00 QI:0/-1/0/0/-1/1/1/0/304